MDERRLKNLCTFFLFVQFVRGDSRSMIRSRWCRCHRRHMWEIGNLFHYVIEPRSGLHDCFISLSLLIASFTFLRIEVINCHCIGVDGANNYSLCCSRCHEIARMRAVVCIDFFVKTTHLTNMENPHSNTPRIMTNVPKILLSLSIRA